MLVTDSATEATLLQEMALQQNLVHAGGELCHVKQDLRARWNENNAV